MKKTHMLKVAVVLLLSSLMLGSTPSGSYPGDDVEMSTVVYKGHHFKVVEINRSKERIKAKYFAFKEDNKSVSQRYEEWKYGKSIVLVSSGTYMDGAGTPQGLTIDNGRLVNESLGNWDALAIVYATGGIAVADLKNNKVNIKCGTALQHFDVKNSSYEKQQFIQCAQSVSATTFQTHLLVYNDNIRVASNASTTPRERRFLIAAKKNDVLYHVVINIQEYGSLLERTQEAYKFMKEELGYTNIIYMLNLDVGAQDIYKVYNPDGAERSDMSGAKALSTAANLVVYYYE
jgi:ABC-type amino acid transport substrate-binding protein